MTGCGHEHEDAAYVLGALSPRDRLDFERHLAGCDHCTRSVNEIAGLPGLLARVPLERVNSDQQPPSVPDTLLPGLVRRVRQRQQRRNWATAGLVAAAVAIAGISVGSAINRDQQPPAPQAASQPTSAPKEFAPVGAPPISGWVSLTPVSWGTRLDLTCSYKHDAYADQPRYTVVITRRDGTTEDVGSWTAQSGRTIHVAATTFTKAPDIARVVVRTSTGTNVLQLTTLSG